MILKQQNNSIESTVQNKSLKKKLINNMNTRLNLSTSLTKSISRHINFMSMQMNLSTNLMKSIGSETLLKISCKMKRSILRFCVGKQKKSEISLLNWRESYSKNRTKLRTLKGSCRKTRIG